ncbi:MAG TPA: DUF2085 domain-containing protein [Vicinamibacterales bacterium]
MARPVAAALLLLGTLWTAVIATTPCVDLGPSRPVLRAARMIGRVICHQRVERSFAGCGEPWPVCGRCAGLYFGVPLALAGLVLPPVRRTRTWMAWRRIVLTAAVPTGISWLAEVSGVVDPGTPLRFAAAVPLGAAVAGWLAAVARGDLR